MIFSGCFDGYTCIDMLCRCRAISAKFFGERNGDAQHTVHVMGHCHIDSGEYLL